MKISIQLKRLGKKRVHTVDFTLDSNPGSLEELIKACVKSEVTRYNEKRESVKLAAFLSPKEIQDQSQTGKIGFGEIENQTLANEQEAIENALLAFKDGLYAVFVDEEPIEELAHPISLSEDTVLTFIRMTFLSGTHWFR